MLKRNVVTEIHIITQTAQTKFPTEMAPADGGWRARGGSRVTNDPHEKTPTGAGDETPPLQPRAQTVTRDECRVPSEKTTTGPKTMAPSDTLPPIGYRRKAG